MGKEENEEGSSSIEENELERILCACGFRIDSHQKMRENWRILEAILKKMVSSYLAALLRSPLHTRSQPVFFLLHLSYRVGCVLGSSIDCHSMDPDPSGSVCPCDPCCSLLHSPNSPYFITE